MQILDGRKIANDIKDEIADVVSTLRSNNKKAPHLAAILVGDDGASETYINAKVKACERVGFRSTLIRLKEDVSEVRQGFECGMSIENFNDIKVGDIIEAFDEVEIERKIN